MQGYMEVVEHLKDKVQNFATHWYDHAGGGARKNQK